MPCFINHSRILFQQFVLVAVTVYASDEKLQRNPRGSNYVIVTPGSMLLTSSITWCWHLVGDSRRAAYNNPSAISANPPSSSGYCRKTAGHVTADAAADSDEICDVMDVTISYYILENQIYELSGGVTIITIDSLLVFRAGHDTSQRNFNQVIPESLISFYHLLCYFMKLMSFSIIRLFLTKT